MKKDIYVVGAVITRDGKILCAQRGSTKTLAHKWEFPGGKIETDETAEEALKRELQEEMLCDIKVGKQVDHTVYEYDFGIVHLSTFFCEIISGEPVLTEHAAIKWLPPEEIASLDWAPADIPAIEIISQMAGRL